MAQHLVSSSPVPNFNPEAEHMNLAQKAGDKKNKISAKEVKSKIEALQI